MIDLLPMFGPHVLLITPFRFFEVQQRIVDVGLTSLAFFAEFDLSLPINLGDLDPVLVRLTIRTPQVGQRTACTCLRVGFMALIVVDDAASRIGRMVTFAQEVFEPPHLYTGIIVELVRPTGPAQVRLFSA